jgi:hypothetical protein
MAGISYIIIIISEETIFPLTGKTIRREIKRNKNTISDGKCVCSDDVIARRGGAYYCHFIDCACTETEVTRYTCARFMLTDTSSAAVTTISSTDITDNYMKRIVFNFNKIYLKIFKNSNIFVIQ